MDDWHTRSCGDGRGHSSAVEPHGSSEAACGQASERSGIVAVPEVVENTDQLTLFGFIAERVQDSTAIYTDEHGSNRGLPNHTSVKHSAGQFINGMAHTNGIESF